MIVFRELRRFVLLLAFWLLLSGQYNALFISMGVAGAALVTLLTRRLIDHTLGAADAHPGPSLLRLLPYLGWLFGRMVVSALQVAWIILHPEAYPHPGIVHFRTQLASPAARTLLANSITLVPGTMTVDIAGDELMVHAFTPDAASDLSSAELQNRIATVFRDVEQQPPQMRWENPTTSPSDGGHA